MNEIQNSFGEIGEPANPISIQKQMHKWIYLCEASVIITDTAVLP